MDSIRLLSLLSLALPLTLGGCVVHAYTGDGKPAPAPTVAPAPWNGKVQRVTGPNYVVHAASDQNLCWDVSGDKAQANQALALFKCHGKENQRFAFVDRQGDTSGITAIGGLCVDVRGGGTADGTPVNVFPCGNDQPNQTFRHFEDGRIHEIQSHKCLTASPVAQGTHLTLQTCAVDNAQQVWVLTQ